MIEEKAESARLRAACEQLRQERETQARESAEALRQETEARELLESECGQLRQEKQDLEQELAEAERLMETGEAAEHYKAMCRELEDRIGTYEKRTVAVTDVLVDAKVQAEHILTDAGSKADYMIHQATQQAELQKRAAETAVRRTVDQNIGQMQQIRHKLQEYLDVLDSVCRGVEQARDGLGQSVAAIPEDVESLRRIAGQEGGAP